MGHYSTAVDMWSIGCIMAEIVNLQPLFEAESEVSFMLLPCSPYTQHQPCNTMVRGTPVNCLVAVMCP